MPQDVDYALEIPAQFTHGFVPDDFVVRRRDAEFLDVASADVEEALFDEAADNIFLVGAGSERVAPWVGEAAETGGYC